MLRVACIKIFLLNLRFSKFIENHKFCYKFTSKLFSYVSRKHRVFCFNDKRPNFSFKQTKKNFFLCPYGRSSCRRSLEIYRLWVLVSILSDVFICTYICTPSSTSSSVDYKLVEIWVTEGQDHPYHLIVHSRDPSSIQFAGYPT